MTTHRSPLHTLARLLVAAVAGALLLTLAPATPAGAASPTGWLRAGHLAQGSPTADVRLTPFAGGKTRTLDGVAFGTFSPYTRLPVGLYTVSLVPAGSPASAAPMISQNVRVRQDSAATVIATGSGEKLRASVLDDDLRPPGSGLAKVRLVSASAGRGEISARVLDGPTLAEDVRSGASTGYAQVRAQTWTIRLSTDADEQDVLSRVPVKAGGVYTLVALTTASGDLALRAVRDSASSTSTTGAMPTGGVDTGGGGLARARATGGLGALLATVSDLDLSGRR